jgi:hypothetical protein
MEQSVRNFRLPVGDVGNVTQLSPCVRQQLVSDRSNQFSIRIRQLKRFTQDRRGSDTVWQEAKKAAVVTELLQAHGDDVPSRANLVNLVF